MIEGYEKQIALCAEHVLGMNDAAKVSSCTRRICWILPVLSRTLDAAHLLDFPTTPGCCVATAVQRG